MKTFLLSISRQKCEKINLANLELEDDKFVIKNNKEVKSEEFKQHNDWRLELIFNEGNEILQSFKKSNVQKIKIKDIAEVFRGKSVLKKDIQPGKHKVLNISDIEEGEINYKNMSTIFEDTRKLLRYELEIGDVVISCRGTMNKVAVFKSNSHKVIASANLIVIRSRKNIFGDYLKIFLESPVGSTLIKSFQRGSTIMNINLIDIQEIEIPLLGLEKQKEIIEHYRKEKMIFKETTEKAHKRWNEQKSNIYSQLWKQEDR
jgi:restriction endonuclease S subunit